MYQNLAAGGKKKFVKLKCSCISRNILLLLLKVVNVNSARFYCTFFGFQNTVCARQSCSLVKKKQCPSFTEFFNRKVMQYVLLSSSHCLCSVRCVWKFPSTKKVLIRFLKFFLPLCARLFLSNSYVISISKRTCQKRHIKVTLVCSSRFQTLKMQVAIVVQLKKVFEKNLNLSSIYQRRFSKSFF